MFGSLIKHALRALLRRVDLGAGVQDGADIARALRLHQAGRWRDAETLYERILAGDERHAGALRWLGVLYLERGSPDRAVAMLERAIACGGSQNELYIDLGNALAQCRRFADAEHAYIRAIELDRSDVVALRNLAKVQLDTWKTEEAIETLRRAAILRPEDPAIPVEIGIAHYRAAIASNQAQRHDTCISILREALARPGLSVPDASNATVHLGHALTNRKRYSEALELFAAELARSPDNLDARVGQANCLSNLGMADAAYESFGRCHALAPGNLAIASSTIVASDYVHTLSAPDSLILRTGLAREFGGPDPAAFRGGESGGRLRLGYVSPNFGRHVAMNLFSRVLAAHDRDQFEIIIYDSADIRDGISADLRSVPVQWREVDRLDAAALAGRIREDGIEIAVDLAGHTRGNRLDALARRPAPIQVTWLGYPGSTGLGAIDYLISDPHTSPHSSDLYCSERIWRLPRTRFCYQPPKSSPEPRRNRISSAPTFGCFNTPLKLNPRVFAAWRLIAEQIPDSRFVLKSAAYDDSGARTWIAESLVQAGLDPRHFEIRGSSPYEQMLGEYSDIDVALDTFPFCGGLTSLDAIWMGVPVVTLEQPLIAGRQTLSFLYNIGRSEWVTRTLQEYARLAVDIACSPRDVDTHRAGLRDEMRASPLMDYAAFTRELESAYMGMWRAAPMAGR